MTAIAAATSTFAIAVVAALVALFVLLLVGSFLRARRAAGRLSAEGDRPGAAPKLGAQPQPAAATARPGAGEKPVSRRDFFRGGLLASLAVFGAQFGGASIAFLWPQLKGGFGAVIQLEDTADAIKNQIRSTRQPYYFGSGKFYLVNYAGGGDQGGGPYQGLTSEGLMALYQKCAHLGCRVPFCDQSQWFECPCHGSKYNYAGEWKLGPAPTGLHRFQVSVEGGRVLVDTSTVVTGPPRGVDTIDQAPEGPFCVGGAA